MHLIDTHTHLFLEHFDEDREEVIKNAQSEGICQFILPNVDLSTYTRLIDVCTKYDACYPALGLHPTSVNENWENDLEQTMKLISQHSKIIAIGEIGIDLYWDKTYFSQQQIVFKEQLKLAKEKNLPVIIHARDSFKEIYEAMDSIKDQLPRGVFHSFTGNEDDVEKILTYENYMIGVGGIVTFKNSNLSKPVSHIPKDKLILETDSPYLAPHPNRGKRNESKFLMHVANKIAEIWQTDIEEVAEITTRNAQKLFKLN